MKEYAVEAKKLGKKYHIGKRRRVDSIRDVFSLKSDVKLFDKRQTKDKQFWALKDVSFNLEKGETLGIIGRNGAGKSTLLKILARVVTPTTGTAVIRGKVASLLEVGTGFHPELSGRENVYFNGAMLGMSKSEIMAKYDQIVEFSEIKKFIDTPIKHYSSGMKVRLAFSVASHLEAEIMIIDEALAAGDVAFREKSLEKMREDAFGGRTVLFVTHSMGAAQDLCERAIFLEHGRIKARGKTKDVIDAYLGNTSVSSGHRWTSKDKKKAYKQVIPEELNLRVDGKIIRSRNVAYGKEVEAELVFKVKDPKDTMGVGVSLLDENNRRLFRSLNTDAPKGKRIKLKKGLNKMSVKLPTSFLLPGAYTVAMDAEFGKEWLIRPNQTEVTARFNLQQPDKFMIWNNNREAIIKPVLHWRDK